MKPEPPRRLLAGRISGCYGIKGWVRLISFTDPIERLLDYPQWYTGPEADAAPLACDSGRRQGKGLVAHIAGVDDRTAAEGYHGTEIYIDAADFPALEEGEYYWYQLVGLEVWCRQAGKDEILLGCVDHLMQTGANDVLVVDPCQGSVDDRQRLLPWLPGSVVKAVELDRSRITVDWDPDF